MNLTEDRRSTRSSAIWWFVVLVVLPVVLYQLSIGPVGWLVFNGKVPDAVLPWIPYAYAPMTLVAYRCEWYCELIDQYLTLWNVQTLWRR